MAADHRFLEADDVQMHWTETGKLQPVQSTDVIAFLLKHPAPSK